MNFLKKSHEHLTSNSIEMSKTLIKIFILSLIIVACSSEDYGDNEPSSNSIEVSFDENPRSGDLVTTIPSDLEGNLNFSLTSQTVSNAFTLNNNGELRVAAWQIFDFETYPILGATISISNGTDTENKIVAVNLNDNDDIWGFLNDSRTAYENANDGDWISITESEYNDLAFYLMDVDKVGASDGQYNVSGTLRHDSSYYTYSNDNNADIPQSSFLFAFKYYCHADNVTNTSVKLSETSASEGFQDIGNGVPMHDSGNNYFVLKGNNQPTMEMAYLALGAEELGYYNVSGHTFYYDTFNVNELPYTWSGIAKYQGLTTTLKQWD